MNTRMSHTMRALGMVVGMALMVACAGPVRRHEAAVASLEAAPSAVSSLADHGTEGATVARHLQERYNESRPDCRKDVNDPNPLPALLCSGVLFGATARGAGFYVWNPNPNNAQPNGVSFSWLRRDSAMSGVAWGLTNGFIILPHFYADGPEGYVQLIALCVFPVDGATNNRRSVESDGCGAHPVYPGSGPCQAQGITTSAQWMARFGNGALYGQVCGFTIKPGTAQAYQAFIQQGLIRAALGARGLAIQNEVKIGAWPANSKIPLEAFFYLSGSTPGLTQARANQTEFQQVMGRWVPVIRVTLPTGFNGVATFVYDPADQQIP